MPDRRWLRPEDLNAFKEGQVWERIKGRHEPSVKIVREVLVSRLGRRFLVEGLTSQRQWWVTETTLLYSYKPKPADEGQTEHNEWGVT